MDRPDRRLTFPQPGRSLILFPLTIGCLWAVIIGVFATVGRVWGPEDERGTWGEVLGAVGGNFVLVFVLSFAISLFVRFQQRRRQS